MPYMVQDIWVENIIRLSSFYYFLDALGEGWTSAFCSLFRHVNPLEEVLKNFLLVVMMNSELKGLQGKLDFLCKYIENGQCQKV